MSVLRLVNCLDYFSGELLRVDAYGDNLHYPNGSGMRNSSSLSLSPSPSLSGDLMRFGHSGLWAYTTAPLAISVDIPEF